MSTWVRGQLSTKFLMLPEVEERLKGPSEFFSLLCDFFADSLLQKPPSIFAENSIYRA